MTTLPTLKEGFKAVVNKYIGKGERKTPGWFLNQKNEKTREEIRGPFTTNVEEAKEWVNQNNENAPS